MTIIQTAKDTLNDVGSAIGLTSSSNSTSKPNKKNTGIKVPLMNPLFQYASYTYIIGLGVLTTEQLNHPDLYMKKGEKISYILKEGNIDPSNRIKTSFGKFDFFIDDLELNQIIGFTDGNTTNVNTLKFKITEPYSMGLFYKSAMQAAADAGHKNWSDAPFILTIEFKGVKENGMMDTVKNTKRYIPIKMNTVDMTVNESGSVYNVSANSYNVGIALDDRNTRLKTDISIRGSTVQEILQTGEKSLQAALNRQLQILKDEGLVSHPDSIIILFPTNVIKDSDSDSNKGKNSATTNTKEPKKDVYSTIGVKIDSKNNYIQDINNCNELGKASLGFGKTRKASNQIGKASEVFDPKGNFMYRFNNQINQTIGDMQFAQGLDIMSIIDIVLLNSEHPTTALNSETTNKDGIVNWWRIEPQVYINDNDENFKSTGLNPRIIVYNIIPYKTHLTSGPIVAPNTKMPGIDELYKDAIKHYNYIYTGKNIDILKFNIHYEGTLSTLIAADLTKNSVDVKNKDSINSVKEPEANTLICKGDYPSNKLVNQTSVSYSGLNTSKDKLGGGGEETSAIRVAKIFHDAITKTQADMTVLDMDIIGDPFYIAQSGMGNYVAGLTEHKNLHDDFTVNFQHSEVNVVVNFRTPVDINDYTGLYNFGKNLSPIGKGTTDIVDEFSGVYHLTTLTSYFKNGKFTQNLRGTRRLSQELDMVATKEQLYSPKQLEEQPNEETTSDYSKTINGNALKNSNKLTDSQYNTKLAGTQAITPTFSSGVIK